MGLSNPVSYPVLDQPSGPGAASLEESLPNSNLENSRDFEKEIEARLDEIRKTLREQRKMERSIDRYKASKSS